MNAALAIALLSVALVAAADEAPQVLHVGTVKPNVIGITVQAQHVVPGRQLPYEERPGDELRPRGKERLVFRGGQFLGWLVGEESDIVFTEDQLLGEPLDTAWADRPESYTVRHGGEDMTPVAVHRKTKPSNFARWNGWPHKASLRHVIYLALPRPLEEGGRCEIAFNGGRLPDQAFVYDSAELRSEGVHVSHTGFRPDDPAKVAFLSCWLGSGGPVDFGAAPVFRVLRDETGEEVLAGAARKVHGTGEPEDAYEKDYAGTNVYVMDFSRLEEPGTYRVCVEGVGCSYPFEIGEDVWREAFRTSAKGFYHQRSGIALGPPYTDYVRPRCFHPHDGVVIYHSTCPLMNSGNGLNALGTDKNNFGNLVAGKTDQVVPEAWGGYMDAGDWDRRIQHLRVSRYLIELAGLFPDYFAGVDLNIPESDDGLPDVVSEALFNLDCYRRMQEPDGGVRGGVESAEHPRHGEASWQESLDIMAYAPGVWSSHVYAGVAARAAHFLRDRDPELARLYRESALRAMQWAEAHLDPNREYPHAVNDGRNLAAAELFRLTGDERWHALFLETTVFTEPDVDMFVWRDHSQQEAPWVYVRTERPGMDERIRANCRSAILKEADGRVASTRRTSFRYAKYEWLPGGWGSFSSPDAVSLVRAHRLTGEAKYLEAALLSCQLGLGGNPVNICYTTGLGHKSPQNPLHIDSRVTHQPPPAGITLGGPFDVERHADHWAQKIVATYTHPDVQQWPSLEAFWDVFWYPEICEFTVQSPMSRTSYVWGYLSARGK
jgi:endoglucanase